MRIKYLFIVYLRWENKRPNEFMMVLACDSPAQSVVTLSLEISLSLFPSELISLLAIISQVTGLYGSYPQSSLL